MPRRLAERGIIFVVMPSPSRGPTPGLGHRQTEKKKDIGLGIPLLYTTTHLCMG